MSSRLRGDSGPRVYPGVVMSNKKTGKKKILENQDRCGNGNCHRPANGTDGIGWCMHCEDDSSNALPMPVEEKNQYEAVWTPAGYYYKHKKTGKVL